MMDDGFMESTNTFSGEDTSLARSQWSTRDAEHEPDLIRARSAALAATTCSHPDGFIRIDGSETYESEGDNPAETLQFVTCLCCTASFSRLVIGGAS